MFSPATLAFVGKLHRSGLRCCIITAGAGSTAVAALMSVPGCSRTVLDAIVPYSVASTIELLDYYPSGYVSPSVAADLAHCAYARAQKLHACPVSPPTIAPADPAPAAAAAAADGECLPESRSSSQQLQPRLVGLGATSAISTSYERRGEDRVHVCCRTEEGLWTRSLRMSKGQPRHVQEWMVSCLLLQLLGEVAGTLQPEDAEQQACELCLSMVAETDTEIREKIHADFTNHLTKSFVPYDDRTSAFELLLSGRIPRLLFNKHGVMHFDGRPTAAAAAATEGATPSDGGGAAARASTPPVASAAADSALNALPFGEETFSAQDALYLLYPGSFAPLHYGHTELARVAAQVVRREKGVQLAQKPVVLTFEVAMSRVGKQTLQTPADLQSVARQFIENNQRVVFTSAKLFIDKARNFPHHGFVVGVDTAMRVVNPVYYNNSKDEMIAALRQIEALGCYFVVAGRKWEGSNGWTNMAEVEVPPEVQHMFMPIPEADFRVDISSTEMRLRAAQQQQQQAASP